LSYSAIELFKTCPRKYYYNYILKLPKKDWPWFTFGEFVHLVLELFYKYVKYLNRKNTKIDNKKLMARAFDAAQKIFEKKTPGRINQKQILEAKEVLKAYFDYIKDTNLVPFAIEKSFQFNLAEDVVFVGFIDRIDKTGEKSYKIVDYKTSKKTSKTKESRQLSIYAMAFRMLMNEDIELSKRLEFVKFLDRKPDDVNHDSSKDSELMEELKRDAAEIKIARESFKDEDWVAKSNNFCGICDFKDRCNKDTKKTTGLDFLDD
jgi:RecB family exonuclease